jgi:hypothetical protein
MKNLLLLSLALAAGPAFAADTANEKNVKKLEELALGKASDNDTLTLKGKTDKKEPCTITIKATRFGVAIDLKKDSDKAPIEFRAAKSSKVSRGFTFDTPDENVVELNQIEVTQDERGFMVKKGTLEIDHNENIGSRENVASMELTSNYATNDDPDHPKFDETKQSNIYCGVAN